LISSFVPTFRDNLSGPIFKVQADPLPLKMGPIGCPETSVTDYQTMLRKSPKERKSHSHRGGTLNSRMVMKYLWKWIM